MKAFFDTVRRPLFWGRLTQHQVDGINSIIAVCNAHELIRPQTAYVLATSYHETGARMQPVREGFSQNDREAMIKVKNLCESRGRSNYAARDPQTGQSYYGRGHVQLTHKVNYARAGEKLGIDLVNNPDLALHPEVSATILVRGMNEGWFTKYKLDDFIPSQTKVDFVNARRIVNYMDKAHDIATYAKMFNSALLQLE